MNTAEHQLTLPPTIFESQVSNLERIRQGKVRDIYQVDDDHMLIVTSDRISAFDVVLPDPIPGKGWVLTQISNFWFEWSRAIIPNHVTGLELAEVIDNPSERQQLEGRAVVVRHLNALPIEAVVRGYLIGSGWKDYQDTGAVCGIELAADLKLAGKLPEPIFTPATKADVGEHDENIDFATCIELLGKRIANQIRDTAIQLYVSAAEYALARGLIIADTKFEFGLNESGELFLIDEMLTPDSSRLWPADSYQPGKSPPSFDKQYLRDYLETLDWKKKAPGPRLPDDIIQRTSEKYFEAWRKLTQASPES